MRILAQQRQRAVQGHSGFFLTLKQKKKNTRSTEEKKYIAKTVKNAALRSSDFSFSQLIPTQKKKKKLWNTTPLHANYGGLTHSPDSHTLHTLMHIL